MLICTDTTKCIAKCSIKFESNVYVSDAYLKIDKHVLVVIDQDVTYSFTILNLVES